MPVHVPAPTQPTNKCPKCGAEGVVEHAVGNMASYVCPKCGARWMAPRLTPARSAPTAGASR